MKIAAIGIDEYCDRLVHDTAATNTNVRRFYKRAGTVDAVIGFGKPLGSFA